MKSWPGPQKNRGRQDKPGDDAIAIQVDLDPMTECRDLLCLCRSLVQHPR